MSPQLRTPARVAAELGGGLLAGATAALAAVRPARKPLHPDGQVLEGRLERAGSARPTGVPLIDEPGSDAVVVRLSRAIGLAEPLPDIHGLAIRVLGAGQGPGDLLLASTGSNPLARFVLTASSDPGRWPLTTLLPYRSPTGPVLLGARREAEGRYRLSWARPTGAWQQFGVLRIDGAAYGDPEISFDPVRHRLPGLDQYATIVRLREPAYWRARRSRQD